jgi:hypothetical protein
VETETPRDPRTVDTCKSVLAGLLECSDPVKVLKIARLFKPDFSGIRELDAVLDSLGTLASDGLVVKMAGDFPLAALLTSRHGGEEKDWRLILDQLHDFAVFESTLDWWVARACEERVKWKGAKLGAAALNGIQAGEIYGLVESLSRDAADLKSFNSAGPLADLAEKLSLPEEPVQFLIQDLAELGASSLFSAKAKTFKSTMLVNAGLCVASGRPFAGKFQTSAGPVLHLDGELGETRTLRLYRRLGRGEGIDVVQLARNGLLHYLDLAKPGSQRDPAEWVRIIREKSISLVILDPVVSFYGGDENDATAVRAWWNSAVQPMQSAGAAVALVHHSRKGSQLVADNVSDSVRGSGDWRGAPDLCADIRPDPKNRHLLRVEVSGSRLSSEPPPFYLRVEEHDGGQRIVFAGEPESAIGKTLAAAEAIQDLLNVAGDGGLPRPSILEALEERFAHRTVCDALLAIKERGDVETRRVGRTMVYQRVLR